MKRFFNWFKNISIKNKLYFIAGVMFFLISLELVTLYSTIYLLSAGRAYVGGEGLWSKAEKDATIYLLKYSHSHDENDYKAFQSYINVTLGDQKARIALQKPKPDYQQAYTGFLEGRNQAPDIPRMITLFSWFQYTYYLRKAAYAWVTVDITYIPKLIAMGANLHQKILTNTLTAEDNAKFIKEIYQINSEVTVLADNFSYALGDASRWLESVVLRTLLSIAIIVEVSGILMTILVTFGIRKGISAIMTTADSVKRLDFSTRAARYSNDEIGQLASSFNVMIDDLEKSIQKVTSLSHLAGMAEVASSVLHNVGNILNSINTSIMLLHERNMRSKITSLVDLATLLKSHQDDIGVFFTQDPRGQQIPDFIALLATECVAENQYINAELNALMRHVSHVKNIISMQQSSSRIAEMIDEISLDTVLDESIQLSAVQSSVIEINRDYRVTKPIKTNKEKLLIILVNLLKNSADALLDSEQADKKIILRTQEVDALHIKIEIIDNGIGILPEDINKIFSHGFTLKKSGHGIGLHTSTNYADELGGKLSVSSQGKNCGATFTLMLPYQLTIKKGIRL
jgi:signal transduction histidine kinase